ncbi:hypothetical protein ENTCAN_06499 [Enterobacter cancerogenus ATCC 35316]|nr:hypothetical protein ENTCAN_06499 [Enterobacter cancerogenus ATCC 35316]
MKILFNIRLFYGDLPHIFPCPWGWRLFGISCCALFLTSIKCCKSRIFYLIEKKKSQRKNFSISTLFNTVIYA